MDQARSTAQAFYHLPAWRRLRAAVLAAWRQCQDCGAPATVVDHVVPRRLAPDRSLDPSNCRALCRRCHGRKTLAVDGGWGRA